MEAIKEIIETLESCACKVEGYGLLASSMIECAERNGHHIHTVSANTVLQDGFVRIAADIREMTSRLRLSEKEKAKTR